MKQICILAAVVVVFNHGAATSAQPEKQQVDTWEYGVLQLATARWTTAKENVVGDRVIEGLEQPPIVVFASLARKLKAAVPNDPDSSMIVLAVLNRLGSQGWELVTIDKSGNDPGVYYFKRRKP